MRLVLTALLFFCLVVSCRGIRPVGDAEFTDQQREKLFRLTPAKLAVLRRAANDRLPPEYRDNPRLLNHYDYWPIIVDYRFRGLWYFDNYSHAGPLLIINGKQTAKVVPLMPDQAATLDSLQIILRQYSHIEITQLVRDSIRLKVEAIFRQ